MPSFSQLLARRRDASASLVLLIVSIGFSLAVLDVFVVNVASQPGETTGYTVSDHLAAIEEHIGGNLFDYVIVNGNFAPSLPPSAVEAGITRVVYDRDRATNKPVHYILADVVSPRISTHHDPDKLARVIMKRVWR